jgi:ribosomal protein S18 acetylase RimI-like enzyme
MQVCIRGATGNDLDALVALNAQVQKLHARLEPSHFRAVTDEAEIRTFFSGKLGSPRNSILLAFDQAQPVGYLWFEIQNRAQTVFTYATRRIYVHHIAVDASARRRGAASALLSRVEDKARSEGICRIVLDAWAANHDAQHFFFSKGFAPFNLVFGKSIHAGELNS